MDDFGQMKGEVIEALEKLTIHSDKVIGLINKLKEETEESVGELKELNLPDSMNIKEADETVKEWIVLLSRANMGFAIASLRNFSQMTGNILEWAEETTKDIIKIKSYLKTRG